MPPALGPGLCSTKFPFFPPCVLAGWCNSGVPRRALHPPGVPGAVGVRERHCDPHRGRLRPVQRHPEGAVPEGGFPIREAGTGLRRGLEHEARPPRHPSQLCLAERRGRCCPHGPSAMPSNCHLNCSPLPGPGGRTVREREPGAARGRGHAGGSAVGRGCAWRWAHWKGCAWSCCSAERREGGVASRPPQFNSVLWRAGEELFSMFLRFPLCLFLSFFVFWGVFLVFLFNWLNTSWATSHAAIPSAALEGNEAFAAKSDPCLFPQPPGSWGSLGLSSPGACVWSAEGARARLCLGRPAPCSFPCAAASPRCLPFLSNRPWGGLPWGGLLGTSRCPPAQRLRCK